MMSSTASVADVVLASTSGQFVVFSNYPVHPIWVENLIFRRRWSDGSRRGDDQAVVALAEHDHAVVSTNLAVKKAFGQALGVNGIQIQQLGPRMHWRVCGPSRRLRRLQTPTNSAMKLFLPEQPYR